MSVVVALHGRCHGCARPLARPVRTAIDRLCGPCFEGALARAMELRTIFEGLRELGVSRESANAMMKVLIEVDE